MADSKPKASAAKKPEAVKVAAAAQRKARDVGKDLDTLIEAISQRFGVPQEILRGEPEPVQPPQIGQEEAA